jgi:hypothetical protein
LAPFSFVLNWQMSKGAPSRWPRLREWCQNTTVTTAPESHGVLRCLTLAESRLTVIFGQYSSSFLAMNTLAVLMVPIYGKRLKFFRRHIAPPSSLVSLLLPRFAVEAITCAGVCQYIHPSHRKGADHGRTSRAPVTIWG